MPYTFVTPTVPEGPAGGGNVRLWDFYTLDRGVTVIRVGTKFSQVRFPTQDLLAEVDEYWLGGTTNTVSDSTAADLIAAGFSDYITEIV
jgi:hypothetical protein